MEELLMECEEEELQPWQRKLKAVVVDDDDELIFVGEIVSAKTPTSNTLNRVNPGSSPRGIQNGSPGRGAVSTFKSTGPQFKTLASPAGTMAVSPVYQGVSRPTTSSVVLQPLSRPLSVSGSTQSVPRPIPASLTPQQSSRPISGVSQTICRAATIPVTSQPISRNVSIPISAQSGPRPVATVTAQPVIANQGYILSSPPVTQKNSPGTMFGVQQKEIKQYPSTPTLSLTANANVKENVFASKRPAMQEVSLVPPKISKPIEAVKGNSSTCTFVTVTSSPSQLNSFKGSTAGSIQVKNGTPFPSACPKCSINFNLLDSLKNHMKYCCPDMLNTLFAGAVKTESSSSPRYEEGKLIMLVSDFYYGKHDGDLDLVQKEKKTNTTFKCFSCGKVLKNNVRFMNHMKHHLELEKQNSESWESHTTCHHCYRQFPTPFQLQCHIESSHTLYESTTICKICELSYENEQVLLQHMKDNHKPGEMPYVCQVCSYRSSLFSDVESHFRTVHENTKALLCPFCLKVVRIGTPYMQHYMKHQRKGIHRCAKCRLQFLTSKEKMDHRTQHHRTFKKPKQLEGLPPGTKVTIRATVGSLHTESSTTSPVSTSSATSLETCSKTKNMNTKVQMAAVKSSTPKSQPNASNSKLQTNSSNPKTPSNSGSSKALVHSSNQKTPLNSSASKTQSNASNSKTQPNSSQSKLQPNASQTRSQPNPPKNRTVPTTMKKKKNFNTALKNLRNHFGTQKCIECYSIVKDFASHFSTYVNCSVCRYSTSCSKAYTNHMVSFHSNRSSKRFASFKKPLKPRRGLTTVCLNCDFLTGDSGIDAMAKHMSENPHSCQIVFENDVGKHEKKLQDETFSEKNLLHSEKPSGLAELNVENASTSAHESKIEDEASLEAKIESSGTEITEDADEKDTKSRAPLKNENYPISDAQGTCLDELTCATTASEIDEKIDLVMNDLQQELASDKTDLKIHPHTANAQSSDPKKEENLAEIDEKRSTEPVSGDVTFEQFLRRDEPESVCSDFSDQGSIHLEPLTPSEVLEYQATEILQKGGISPSTKKDIDSSEHTDDIPLESSPCEGEASTSLNITSEES